MSKELKLKILNVLKNELEHERMIRSNVLRSRVIAGHDESFSILSNISSSTIFTLHIFDNIQIESPCSVIFGNSIFQIAQ